MKTPPDESSGSRNIQVFWASLSLPDAVGGKKLRQLKEKKIDTYFKGKQHIPVSYFCWVSHPPWMGTLVVSWLLGQVGLWAGHPTHCELHLWSSGDAEHWTYNFHSVTEQTLRSQASELGRRGPIWGLRFHWKPADWLVGHMLQSVAFDWHESAFPCRATLELRPDWGSDPS